MYKNEIETAVSKPNVFANKNGSYRIGRISYCSFFWNIIFCGNAGTVNIAKATSLDYETIDSGSYIINMGQATQSRANALLSFGRVYDLVNAYSTPLGK